MRRDYVQPFFTSSVKPMIFYSEKGYVDFDVQNYPFIKKYHNWIRLLFLLIINRPDIVVSQEPFFVRLFPINLATYIYSKFFNKKYIVIAIENIDPYKKYGSFFSALKFFCRIYISSAEKIICLNKDAERLIVRYSNSSIQKKFEDVFFGVWGVDINEFTPEISDEDPDLGENAILFIGRLIEGKGLLQLIEAMDIVAGSMLDARLFIIGNGPLEKQIQSLDKEYITYLGGVKNAALPGYFRSARVTSVPALTTKKWAEQVGMVNIQSIACGTPVVSTISGSISEYIPDKEVGLLVKENDIEALAEALIKLLSDRELNKAYGANGRKLAVERYDSSESLNDFLRLVNRLSGREINQYAPGIEQ